MYTVFPVGDTTWILSVPDWTEVNVFTGMSCLRAVVEEARLKVPREVPLKNTFTEQQVAHLVAEQGPCPEAQGTTRMPFGMPDGPTAGWAAMEPGDRAADPEGRRAAPACPASRFVMFRAVQPSCVVADLCSERSNPPSVLTLGLPFR